MGQGHRENDGLGQTSTPEEKIELKDQFYDLNFSIGKSRRYHEKLCAFYGVWRDWIKIVSVIAGSSAFLLLMASATRFAELIVAFVAVWAILDFLIQPDKKADKHCELKEKFTELAIKIAKNQPTPDLYCQLLAARLEIEKLEPPCKRLIDLQARNEECRARDFPPEDIVPLSRWQRTFGYFVTFGMKRLEDWKAERQRQVRAAGTS